MKFYARNRYLVIEVQKEEERHSGIMLPEDYKKKISHKVGKILDAPQNSEFRYDIGCKVLFAAGLMEEFEVDGQTVTVIPESVVYGVFRERPAYEQEY